MAIASASLVGQATGSLTGTVYNAKDSTTIPGVNIRIETGQAIMGDVTDIEGKFRVRPIPPGVYKVVISHVSYGEKTYESVAIDGNEIKFLGNIYLSEGKELIGVTIDAGLEPQINKNGGSLIKIDSKRLDKLPTKGDLTMILKYIGSEFYVNERDNSVHFRGSRNNTSAFYVDGVRVDNLGQLPGFAVGSMKIYGGGIPAMYGDFTGGVVVVETKSYNDGKQERESLFRYLEETKAPKYITIEEYEKSKKEKAGEPESQEINPTEPEAETK